LSQPFLFVHPSLENTSYHCISPLTYLHASLSVNYFLLMESMGNAEEIRKIRKRIKVMLRLARKHMLTSLAIMEAIPLAGTAEVKNNPGNDTDH
jgi:hypothetical protein